jgi:hypothetical protein
MSRGTSLADERHTSLPPYESRTAHIHRLSFPPADMNCVISGGVRFPFTEEAKANFDRNALRRLESGLSAYWFEPGVLGCVAVHGTFCRFKSPSHAFCEWKI